MLTLPFNNVVIRSPAQSPQSRITSNMSSNIFPQNWSPTQSHNPSNSPPIFSLQNWSTYSNVSNIGSKHRLLLFLSCHSRCRRNPTCWCTLSPSLRPVMERVTNLWTMDDPAGRRCRYDRWLPCLMLLCWVFMTDLKRLLRNSIYCPMKRIVWDVERTRVKWTG